jgi:CMP-N-acetylneuraminic acid synthetase
MRILGLINARGGSTGIPRKNIKILAGKPLIAYAIEAGRAAACLSRIVVSTDDDEIAAVAKLWGAEVPFMRPACLATAAALQIDAVKHAISTLRASGDAYDAVAILQPTCPMRTAEDIDGAMALMERAQADSVISVTRVEGQHPLTMYVEESDGALKPLMDSNPAGVLRQKFSDVWWRNGAVYGVRTQVVMERNSLYGSRTIGYRMPPERTVNIDEPLDWDIAEALLERQARMKCK